MAVGAELCETTYAVASIREPAHLAWKKSDPIELRSSWTVVDAENLTEKIQLGGYWRLAILQTMYAQWAVQVAEHWSRLVGFHAQPEPLRQTWGTAAILREGCHGKWKGSIHKVIVVVQTSYALPLAQLP